MDHEVQDHVHIDAAGHDGRQPVRLDEAGGFEVRTGGLNRGVEPLDLSHEERALLDPGRGEHGGPLFHGRGHRLLDEDVKAALQTGEREIGVARRGRGDRDRIHLVEERLERLEHFHLELTLRALPRDCFGIVGSGQRGAVDSRPGARVVGAEVSYPDHAHAKPAHRTMPRSELRTNSMNSWISG